MPPEHLEDIASALILKGLCFERTPETPQGERNWDYRYSWIRDSVFTVKAPHIFGFQHEARRFSKFIERAAAGSANELQLMYGLDGKRRMPEVIIECLEGYRGAKPVRVGNRAARQTQLDVYGWLLHLAWTWHDEAHPVEKAAPTAFRLCRLPGSHHAQAKAVYERAVACANGPGLFSEEMNSHSAMAGNVPQALTHVSQIMAGLALQGKLGVPPSEHDS